MKVLYAFSRRKGTSMHALGSPKSWMNPNNSIEGMVRAFWSSHCHTNGASGVILRNINVLLLLAVIMYINSFRLVMNMGLFSGDLEHSLLLLIKLHELPSIISRAFGAGRSPPRSQ